MEYEICRACLNSTVTLVDIFVNRQQRDPYNPEPSLAEMLNEIANCYVKFDDELPQKICLSCVIGAQNAWRFKRTCERSFRHLTGLEPQLKQELPQEQELNTQQEEQQEQQQQQVEENQQDEEPEQEEEEEPQQMQLDPLEQSEMTENLCNASDFLLIKLETTDKTKTIEAETTEKPYKCNMCSKAFAHKKILRVHKAWHAENKSKAASAIKKGKQPSQLELQNLIIQSNTQFQCSVCQSSFQSSSGLKRHLYMHTGECPFPCPYCSAAFYRSDYVKKHIRKVHGKLDYSNKSTRIKTKTAENMS